MDYTLNNYRIRKIGEVYFITTDHGSYCILSKDELKKLKNAKINEELYKKLEEKEVILTENNIHETIRLLKNRNSFLFYGTSLHIMAVTLRCNMNCVYCHASSMKENEKKYDMSQETAKETVDFIFQSPNQDITIEFQGGEPMLNWSIIKYIIEYAKEKNETMKKNLIITLVTNMSLLNQEKMDYLINNDIAISTSLDGPKEIHDFNRKLMGGSNYEQVVYWINKFNKEYKKRGIKNRRMGALVTLTKKSLNYPKEIVDEYIKNGLKDIHLRYLNKMGVAKKTWHNINYSSEEYLNFWKKAVSYIEELNKKENKLIERMVRIMTNKIGGEFDPNYLDLRSPCGAAIGQLAYNYDGNIYTCDEARSICDEIFLIGNVKVDNYKSVVSSDKACAMVATSINDQYACNDCAYKPYCGVCPVCNYAETGKVILDVFETVRCKIFMEQFDWVVKEKFINQHSNK